MSAQLRTDGAISADGSPETLRGRQLAWLLAYFFDGGPHFSVGCRPTYDAETELCDAFAEAFPGRKRDPSHRLAGARLYRLLSGFDGRRGFFSRGRLSNHDQYHPQQEPNWQLVWQLNTSTYLALREGRTTPARVAWVWEKGQ